MKGALGRGSTGRLQGEVLVEPEVGLVEPVVIEEPPEQLSQVALP